MNPFMDTGKNHMEQYQTAPNSIVGPLGGQHDTPPKANKAGPLPYAHTPHKGVPPLGVRDENVTWWKSFYPRFGNMLPHNFALANRMYNIDMLRRDAHKIKSTQDLSRYKRADTPEHIFAT